MYRLHCPTTHAHLDDLRERLSNCLIFAPYYAHDDSAEHALIRRLAQVVERMDRGQISSREAEAIFARHRIPNFSFPRWLAEMVEEGVYVPKALVHAA